MFVFGQWKREIGRGKLGEKLRIQIRQEESDWQFWQEKNKDLPEFTQIRILSVQWEIREKFFHFLKIEITRTSEFS